MTVKGDKPLRAALYARVSTANHGQDVGLQLDELQQVATQRGWRIVGEFVDEGISGSKASRPALDRMMADARAGKLDLIVVWKLDRLGRSLQHILALLDELTALKVGFVSVRDSGIDTTTPTGKLMLSLIGAFAEYERSLIQERVKAGVARAQEKGVKFGRPRNDIDLRAAQALLSQGHGLREVASMLGFPRSSLRRRLQDAGLWCQNPTGEGGPKVPPGGTHETPA